MTVRPHRRGRWRRAAVLMELIVSLGIFLAAASLTLIVTRNLLEVMDRTRFEQEAVDLARTRLAELEAGLIDVMDLADVPILDDDDPASKWAIEVGTERSAFRGLTLVEIRISAAGADEMPLVTLRQLVRLSTRGEDDEWEEDEMLEGLPEERR